MRAWVLGTIIALVALAVGSVFGDRGILNMVGEREKIEALRGELDGLRAENARARGGDQGPAAEPARDRAPRARGARPRAHPTRPVFLIRDAASDERP
jgi:hypothetical protein